MSGPSWHESNRNQRSAPGRIQTSIVPDRWRLGHERGRERADGKPSDAAQAEVDRFDLRVYWNRVWSCARDYHPEDLCFGRDHSGSSGRLERVPHRSRKFRPTGSGNAPGNGSRDSAERLIAIEGGEGTKAGRQSRFSGAESDSDSRRSERSRSPGLDDRVSARWSRDRPHSEDGPDFYQLHQFVAGVVRARGQYADQRLHHTQFPDALCVDATRLAVVVDAAGRLEAVSRNRAAKAGGIAAKAGRARLWRPGAQPEPGHVGRSVE